MATITKRKNGWSVQIRRKGYPQQTRTLPTKAEAQAWAREQEGRIDRALAPINLRLLKGTTLRAILERYLEDVTPTKDSAYSEKVRLRKLLANARDRRLGPGEYERLMVALQRARNRLIAPVVDFAIHTAMRRGEILALQWEQVNWQQRTAYIADSKTGVPRTIPLLDGAVV